MKNIVFKYASYVALIIGLAGCSAVRLDTKVAPTPQKQPEKLFVILTAPQAWADNAKAFTGDFSQKLQLCGTQTHVFFDSPKAETLSLADDKDSSKERIISEETAFSPDAVMSIHWITSQSAANGYIQGIQFSLALVRWPMGSGGTSWQGRANVPTGGWLITGGGSDLASALFDDLKQKGLLPKCATNSN